VTLARLGWVGCAVAGTLVLVSTLPYRRLHDGTVTVASVYGKSRMIPANAGLSDANWPEW
jgi:hypothetical protein